MLSNTVVLLIVCSERRVAAFGNTGVLLGASRRENFIILPNQLERQEILHPGASWLAARLTEDTAHAHGHVSPFTESFQPGGGFNLTAQRCSVAEDISLFYGAIQSHLRVLASPSTTMPLIVKRMAQRVASCVWKKQFI